MRILITGAKGSVGKEIFENLKRKKRNKLFIFDGDLTRSIKLRSKIDAIIHCASKHYFSQNIKNIKKLYSENIKMSNNLKNFCNKNKVKKLIFLSSVDVYGTPKIKDFILHEDQNLKPNNWYARSKVVSEEIFFKKKNNFKCVSLRIPGVIVGESHKNFPVLLNLMHKLKLGEKVNIHNPVSKFNNVIDVEEISKVINKILLKKEFNDIFNLAASGPMKFLDVIKLIKKKLNSKSKVVIKNKKKISFLISNDKIKNKLNIKISNTKKIINRFCKKISDKPVLAINGGKPLRTNPMPPRKVFGQPELNMVKKVFQNSWKTGVDFGFQGKFEKEFTNKFCDFQGGGYADAVSSGGAAVYIALKALDIKPGSDVIVSPTTNPGGVMPVAIQDVKLIIPDSEKDRFNISPKEFEKSITPKTRAAVLTHLGGHCIDMDPIVKIARSRKIKIVEDCSQAHGATYKGKKVGTFTEIAAFSNGFSKQLAAGGCAGLVYTKNKDLYWKVRSIADRGKPFHKPNFNFRMTTDFLFPSHNLNAEELSCAIGISVLKKLPKIIKKRHEIAKKIDLGLKDCLVVKSANLELPNSKSSIFFHTVKVDLDKINVSKVQFAQAISAEGININYDYRDITSEWKWIPGCVRKFKKTPNSINFRDKTFNILFNEKYGNREVDHIINSILKVESYYKK